jgi:hypothetical protein
MSRSSAAQKKAVAASHDPVGPASQAKACAGSALGGNSSDTVSACANRLASGKKHAPNMKRAKARGGGGMAEARTRKEEVLSSGSTR